MSNINLNKIFCHLVGDDNFLSTIIETSSNEGKNKKSKKKFYNLMENMVTEYIILSPYEIQKYPLFPQYMKNILPPEYARYGIKNTMEKNLNIVNISFLNSLNILLRPDIYNCNLDDHIRQLLLMETFICHKIHRNSYQIDKVKNTKKIQNINKDFIKNLTDGKISHEIINVIINIFEINLLIFDLTKMEMYFYSCHGQKYPYTNLFKDLYCMTYIQGNYEPVMSLNNNISKEQQYKMYTYILSNVNEIKCYPEISLFLTSLILINTLKIPHDTYIYILEKYFNKKQKSIEDLYNDIKILEKTK